MSLKRLSPVIALLASLALAQKAAAPMPAKVADLLKTGAKYDHKIVAVTGNLADFKVRTSKAGRPYLTFDLVQGTQSVAVYSFGKLAATPKDGARVRVTGVFSVLKKMGKREFKNEIDASPKKGVKDGKPAIELLR